jgi:hypothetical protein
MMPMMPPQAPRTDTLAIVGLVLAVLAWPVGLVLSIIAMRRAKKQGTSRGLSIAGVIVSSVVAVASVILIVGIVLFARTVGAPAEAASKLADAYWTGSCQDYQKYSTTSFQDSAGLSGCSEFEAEASSFRDQAKDYSFKVTGTHITNDTAVVDGRETYTDATSGEKSETTVTLHLVHRGDAWLVDSIDSADSSQ